MTYDQTHWVPVQRRGPLPTYYYHEHFVEMLDFVDAHYQHVFLEQHGAFIEDFRELPPDAQRLYVRLVNRKGRVFACNRLRYPELGDISVPLAALQDSGWVGHPRAGHFDEMLSFVTRDDLYRLLAQRFTGLGKSLKKSQLVDFVRANMAPQDFIDALQTRRIVVQRREQELGYLMYLYFGRIRHSLSQFTMRDLGFVRTQTLGTGYEPRFSERDEALESYFYASRLDELHRMDDDELQPLLSLQWPEANYAGSARLRDELALAAGRRLEKAGEPELALRAYQAGESRRCMQRTIRLLLATGSAEVAQTYLEERLANPRSDEELLVAGDIYERKFNKKRTSETTDMLRAADVIDIDESRIGAPERAAVEHFEQQGIAAYRSENLLWRTLFGLLFWQQLYGDHKSTVSSPFDSLPVALSNSTFYKQQKPAIEARLALLADSKAAKKAVLMASTRHYGTPNGVFRWRESMNDAVIALLDRADGRSVADILRRMAKNYADSRYGYPDLMLVDANGVRFVEIKSEGDQLRRKQLLRIYQLRDAGFRADVVRVRWVLDPDQTYVVVDVETTGGKGQNHRVTEIGAVKVRNGRIIDRFQTLLNPQRRIPANIQRLTGIKSTMVADAPYFADVADDFSAFMEDAIFVAHNVDFDYGFIASEFARMGRPFRHAKLCTCASMRKLNPGLKSYNLAELCRHFDIPLKQHHRALCDAEAAAQLLLIVNEKRQDSNPANL